ncbi:hypothetical protein JKP88DRAFT_35968 [Tribonema minus]|uniref:DNA replication complex GINS protein PSF2 n=1 Tax=Tribonema minus TaxID=303371 RepID=A0A836CII2_9STRA|nr:hypothetical protein JKP88DRAFT_35968 [Tribonema minus]
MASHGVPEPGSEASTLRHLSPDELEYLAGDEMVEVVPSESHKRLHFRGTYGPFVAGSRTAVPLWLAIMLKRRNKASIACPPWMTAESLERVLAAERREETFAELPFHYLEISSLLLSVAADDMGQQVDRMRVLLEDIENVRQGKMYKGMGDAAQRADGAIKVNRIGAMELLPVRTFFSAALSSMYDISGAKGRAEVARLQRVSAPDAMGGAAPKAGGGGGQYQGDLAAAPPPQQQSRLRRFR